MQLERDQELTGYIKEVPNASDKDEEILQLGCLFKNSKDSDYKHANSSDNNGDDYNSAASEVVAGEHGDDVGPNCDNSCANISSLF